jgi:CRISPR-associated protein Cas6/Cse3/CasE subtype I-E
MTTEPQNITKTITLYRTRVVAPRGTIKNAYGAHRLFWLAFPNHKEGTVQPFTFSEQNSSERDQKVYLMQSQTPPDFSEVLGVQAETKKITIEVMTGDFLHFRLRGRPTKSSKPVGDGPIRTRGTRESISSRTGIEDWLGRQAEKSGFGVRQLVFDTSEEKIKLQSKTRERSGASETFNVTGSVFDGGMVVTNPDAFEAALFNGIGSGKSYGFGMLLVAR